MLTCPGTGHASKSFDLELLQFPYGHHDDQVDSISQFLNWAAGRVEWHLSLLKTWSGPNSFANLNGLA